MYIEPNSTIRILKSVPLDPTYDHTIYFDDEESQRDWFINKTKYNLDRNTYQRVQRGYIRVDVPAEDLYDCNYLMFQNTGFGTSGSKWFYAFIKSVEYINNLVSQIEFQIDVMQTWFFDYELEMCFVEREHSISDNIGEHIVPENLDTGNEPIILGYDDFTMENDEMPYVKMYTAILYVPVNSQPTQLYNNVYSELSIATVPSYDVLSTHGLIQQIVGEGQEDRIVAIYQYPGFMGDSTNAKQIIYKNVKYKPSFSNFDGYIPKNKKLFTYPYYYMLVSNNQGKTAIYRYEDWIGASISGDNIGSFRVAGAFFGSPVVMVFPTSYRGTPTDYMSGLIMDSFPQCAFKGDVYKQWLAQNKTTIALNAITSVVDIGVSAGIASASPMLGASGSAGAMAEYNLLSSGAGGAYSSLKGVAGLLAKTEDLQHVPPQLHGQAQTDMLTAGMDRYKYTFYYMGIKKEFAQIIDDYFTRFGYATKRNKIPNRKVRAHWTYTKTIGCTIKGSIPCDDAAYICNVYNNGITFWVSGDEVGDYSLDNRPLETILAETNESSDEEQLRSGVE